MNSDGAASSDEEVCSSATVAGLGSCQVPNPAGGIPANAGSLLVKLTRIG
jgi:hypothetical protein